MDSNELLRKVRKIEIKTKGLSQNIFAGEYHSGPATTVPMSRSMRRSAS